MTGPLAKLDGVHRVVALQVEVAAVAVDELVAALDTG